MVAPVSVCVSHPQVSKRREPSEANAWYQHRVPHHVDYHQRRAQVSGAVWRLIAAGGVAAASFRSVAAEAGLGVAAVRHFAATQELLLVQAMRALLRAQRLRATAGLDVRRMRERATSDPLEFAAAGIEDLLPRSPDEVVEARAWAAFGLEAGGVGDDLRLERDREVRGVCEVLVQGLARAGLVHPSRAVDLEVDRLWALVEGLVWRSAVTGELVRPDQRLIRLHLCELSGPQPGADGPQPDQAGPQPDLAEARLLAPQRLEPRLD